MLNSYWRALENKSQKEKDRVLIKILTVRFSDSGYPLLRYYLAAAAFIGANVNTIAQGAIYSSALIPAALFQEYALCQLLFNKGADPNIVSTIFGTPLSKVSTLKLVKLFLQNKADTHHTAGQIGSYLHHAMNGHDHETLLVRLYIEKGLSPLAKNASGKTPLMLLFNFFRHHQKEWIEEKVEYLFETLTPQQVRELIIGTAADGAEDIRVLIERYKLKSSSSGVAISKYV